MIIFLTIIALQISGLILPGPDFFVVISNSIKHGLKYGLYTAYGIASGILINTFIVYWFGSFLLYKAPILFKLIIFIGALYLINIAYGLFKAVFNKINLNAESEITNSSGFEDSSPYKFYFKGLFTNLANVKVFVFFSSMLSLVDELDTVGKIAVWCGLVCSTAIWFSIVALFFGNEKLRIKFFKNIRKIEFISAVCISIFTIIILIELFIN